MHPKNLLEELFTSVLVVNHQGDIVASHGNPLDAQNVFDSVRLSPLAPRLRAAQSGSGFDSVLSTGNCQLSFRCVTIDQGFILSIWEAPHVVEHFGGNAADSVAVQFLENNLGQGTWRVTEGKVVAANSWLRQWLELDDEDLSGRSVDEFLVSKSAISTSSYEGSFRTAKGASKCAKVNHIATTDEHGRVCGTLEVILDQSIESRDRETRAKEAKEASALARLDGLTGLGNRLAFHESLGQLQDGTRHFGVIAADIDSFKSLTEPHDTLLGDRALKEVARRIRTCIRRQDTAARLGRDEFAVLIANASVSTLEEVAYRIESQLNFDMGLDGETPVRFNVSIGAAHSSEGRANVFRSAYQAMQRRKRDRKSRR